MDDKEKSYLEDTPDVDTYSRISSVESGSKLSTIEEQSFDIAFIPESYDSEKEKANTSFCWDLVKYLRSENPTLNIQAENADYYFRHSGDFWLPLAILAQDITLQVYLGLVVNYVYDKLKGALSNRSGKIYCSAEYRDIKDGTTKKFEFKGSPKALEDTIAALNKEGFFND